MESIGARLRAAREWRLKTQEELSQMTGVTEATISRIENDRGEQRPRLSTIKRLADALDVDPAWIMFGEDAGKASGRSDRPDAESPDRIRSAEGTPSVPEIAA